MNAVDLPISISSRVQRIGVQLFFENKNLTQKKVEAWWNKDAQRDEIKSAAGVDKSFAKTPFVKLPNLPKAGEINNKIILDLGCGYGRTLIPLVKYQPKLSIGIDISSIMLEKCIDYANESKVKLVLIHSDFPPIPLKNNSIDLIYSCAVLLHLEKKQILPLMQEMTRVLKPGGKIILQSSFPNSLSIKGLSNWFPSWLKSQLTGKRIIPGMPKHYSRRELKRIFNYLDINFKIKPNGYELIPTSINRFNLPFRKHLRKINTWFESKISGKQNLLIDSFLSTFFDVELT